MFSQAGNFTFGNTSRTSPDLRGPDTKAFDASLFKKFPIRERSSILRELIDSGKVGIAGAMYDVSTGAVTFLAD